MKMRIPGLCVAALLLAATPALAGELPSLDQRPDGISSLQVEAVDLACLPDGPCLAVWRHDPFLLRARLVGADGRPLDTAQLELPWALDGPADDIAVTSNGVDAFMVLTRTRGDASSPDDEGVYAWRFDAQGQPLGTEPISVMPSGFGAISAIGIAEQTLVAKFDVVADTLLLSRLGPEGELLDATPIGLPADVEGEPQIAFDGTHWVVGWLSGTSVRVARVALTGEVVDPGSVVSTADTVRADNGLGLDCGTTHCLVAWADARTQVAANTRAGVFGMRLAFDGTVLDPDGIVIAESPAGQVGHGQVGDVVAVGDDFVVSASWQGTGEARLYRVGADGTASIAGPIATGLPDWPMPGVRVDLEVLSDASLVGAWVRDDEYAAAPLRWSARTSRVGADAMAQTPTGHPLTRAGGALDPQVASSGDVQLVVWRDLRDAAVTAGDLYGVRLDADGQPLDATNLAIDVQPHDAHTPRVAWDGEHFVVAWTERDDAGDRVHMTRVRPDGVVVSTADTVVIDGRLDGLASSTGQSLLLIDRREVRAGGEPDGVVVRVDSDGTVLDPEGLALPGTGRPVAASADPSGFIVATVDHDTFDGALHGIQTLRLGTDGTVGRLHEVSAGQAINNHAFELDRLAMASNGEDHLLFVHDDRETVVLLDAQGRPRDTAPLSMRRLARWAWDDVAILVSPVWDGSEYRLIALGAGPGSGLWQRFTVWQARIAADGTFLGRDVSSSYLAVDTGAIGHVSSSTGPRLVASSFQRVVVHDLGFVGGSSPNRLVTTPEDTPVTVTVTIANPDDLPLEVIECAWAPEFGEASVVGDPVSAGDGQTRLELVYTPDADLHGWDSFRVCIRSSASTAFYHDEPITVRIVAVNDAPVLGPLDGLSGRVGEPLTVQLVATDVDDDPLTFSSPDLPADAELTPSGRLNWVPGTLDVGLHTVTIELSDGQATDSGTLSIEVRTPGSSGDMEDGDTDADVTAEPDADVSKPGGDADAAAGDTVTPDDTPGGLEVPGLEDVSRDDGCCTTVRASGDHRLPRGLGLGLAVGLGLLLWRRRRRSGSSIRDAGPCGRRAEVHECQRLVTWRGGRSARP